MKNPEKFWDFLAKSFDKVENRFEETHSKIIEITKKYLTPDNIVLDYGCATGQKAFELAGKVKEIHGIDISSKMIEIAQKKAAKNGIKNTRFTHAVVFDERLKSSTYDAIIVFNILHLLENPHNEMRRILELLKPGGLIISSTPCLNEKMDRNNTIKFSLFRFLQKTKIIPQHVLRLNFKELKDLISDRNFQILETQKLYDGISSYFIVAKKTKVVL